MQSRNNNFPTGLDFNILSNSVFYVNHDTNTTIPPVSGNFLLLDGTSFLLLDSTNFLLL